MKINELATKVIRQTQHGTDTPAFTDFTFLRTTEQTLEMWISAVVDNQVMFRLVRDGVVLSWIVAVVCTPGYDNRKTFQIRRTWTEPEYRNKGLMTSFYYGLYKYCHFVLLSDIKHSPETVAVWKKLYPVLHPKILDIHTMDLSNPESFDSIYDDNARQPSKVFILEHPEFWYPSWGGKMPYELDCLKEYVLYTGEYAEPGPPNNA